MATYYINPSFSVNGDGSAYTEAATPGAAGAFNSWTNCQAAVTLSGGNSFLQATGTTDTSAMGASGVIMIDGDGASATNRLIIGAYHAATGVAVVASDYTDTPMSGLVSIPTDSYLPWLVENQRFYQTLPVQSGFVRPVLDASEAAAVGATCTAINVANYKYVTIRDMTVTVWDTRESVTGVRRGIICPSSVTGGQELTESQTAKDVVLERLWVHHIGAPTAYGGGTKNANNIGIRRLAGGSLTLSGCLVEDCAEDCLFIAGQNTTIDRCLIRRPDLQDNSGDCLQMTSTGTTEYDNSNITITSSLFDHRDSSNKQVIIISDSSTPPGSGGTISRCIIFGEEDGGVANQRLLNIGQPAIKIETCFIRGASIDGLVYLSAESAGSFVQGCMLEPTYGADVATTNSDCVGVYVYSDNNTVQLNTIRYRGASSPTHGAGVYVLGSVSGNVVRNNAIYGTAYGIQNTTGATETYNVAKGTVLSFANISVPPTSASPGTGSVDVIPDVSPLPTGNCSGLGTWVAGMKCFDDLPLPLRPDIGAVQDRNAAGRKFGVGGGGGL